MDSGGIFFKFGFFLNLIYNFGSQFQNFTEMDPCRPATGRQGCFCKICTARNIEMLRRGPPDGLSPGHWATGPLPSSKMCLHPPGRSFGARNFQKKERGRKSEAAKPYWILGLRSLGNCLTHVLDQYVLHYYIIVLRSIFI